MSESKEEGEEYSLVSPSMLARDDSDSPPPLSPAGASSSSSNSSSAAEHHGKSRSSLPHPQLRLPASLLVSNSYSAVEQCEWESDIRWDDVAPIKSSVEGGFASLDDIARMSQQHQQQRPTHVPHTHKIKFKRDENKEDSYNAAAGSNNLTLKFSASAATGAPAARGMWSEVGPAPTPTIKTFSPPSSPTLGINFMNPLASPTGMGFGGSLDGFGFNPLDSFGSFAPPPLPPVPAHNAAAAAKKSTDPSRPPVQFNISTAPVIVASHNKFRPLEKFVAASNEIEGLQIPAAINKKPLSLPTASASRALEVKKEANGEEKQQYVVRKVRPSYPMKQVPASAPTDLVKPWANLPAHPTVPATQIPATIPIDRVKPSLTTDRSINQEFARMEWLDEVLWETFASNNDAAFLAGIDPTVQSLPAPLPPPPKLRHTALIWDANDPRMIFETPEQLEQAARKERLRQAKLEEERKASEKNKKRLEGEEDEEDEEEKEKSAANTSALTSGFARFNISQDANYDQDQVFTSYARTERVRLAHASFAMDLDDFEYEWYANRANQTCSLSLFPRNWNMAHTFVATDGATATHRPRLPRDLVTALLQAHQKVRVLRDVDTSPSKDVWLDTVAARYETDRRDTRIVPERLDELSMLSGGLILLEYLEQHPLVNLQTGMASRVVTYYRRLNDMDQKEIEVPDGDVVMLGTTEQGLPFLGDIRPGQTVCAVNNNLFVAPIHRHLLPRTVQEAGPPNTTRNDLYCTFLLVKQGKKWYLRNIPAPYVVGQMEPKKAIPAPNSDNAREFLMRFIEFCILSAFKTGRHVNVDMLYHTFFDGSEHDERVVASEIKMEMRRVIKELGGTYIGSGNFQYQLHADGISEERLRKIFSPEDYCLYAAMKYGQWRLQAMGITHFTSPRIVSGLLQSNVITQAHIVRVARYIEKFLELTPWRLSRGFVQCTIEEKGTMLLLNGRGNPLADGAGYSYLVVDKKKKEEEMPEELREVRKKTGTDADLRRLTAENLENALVKFGLSVAQIRGMHRWARVREVARLSTEASAEGKMVNMRRFQRHVRQSLQEQNADFKKQVNEIFDKMLKAISSTSRPEYKHEVIDDPAAVGGKPGVASSKTTALDLQRQQAEEARQAKEFLEQQQAGKSATTADAATQAKLDEKIRAAEAAGKKFRVVRVKRVKHTQLTVLKNGDVIREEKNIIHPQLIHYYEDDQKDQGARLKMALGILDSDEIKALEDAGKTRIPSLSDTTQVYLETADERKIIRGERPKRGRGGKLMGARGTNFDAKDNKQTSLFGRKRGRGRARTHMNEDDLDGDEDDGGRIGRRGRRDYHGDDSDHERGLHSHDDDDHDFDHEDDHDFPVQQSANVPDCVVENPQTGKLEIKCGACLAFGHSKTSLICPCMPKKKEVVPDLYYGELPPSTGRGRPRGRSQYEDEMVDDSSISVSATNGGALKLKGVSRASMGTPSYLGSAVASARMTKRGRDEDEFQWAARKRAASGVSGRVGGDPKIRLNKEFISVVDSVTAGGKSFVAEPFSVPPVEVIGRRYLTVCPKPMDLKTIRRKASDSEYTSRAEFMSDMELIYKNSIIFNGPENVYTIMAREVVNQAQIFINQPLIASRIREAEGQFAAKYFNEQLSLAVSAMQRLDPKKFFQSIFIHPEYAKIITEPIALSVLTERIQLCQYEKVGEFVRDVIKMRDNAVRYNGVSEVSTTAESLLAACLKNLEKSFPDEPLDPIEHNLPAISFATVEAASSRGNNLLPPSSRDGAANATPRVGRPPTGMRASPRRRTPTPRSGMRHTPTHGTPNMLASPSVNTGGRTGRRHESPGELRVSSPGRLELAQSPSVQSGRMSAAAQSPTRAPSTAAAASSSAASSLTPAAAPKASPTPAPLASVPRASNNSPEPLQMLDTFTSSDPGASAVQDDLMMLDVGAPILPGAAAVADPLAMDMGAAALSLDALPPDLDLGLDSLPMDE